MIIPPLEFHEITIDTAELKASYNSKLYTLYVDNKRWMTYDMTTYQQIYQLQLEFETGVGHIVLTGLGLGILTILLAKKPSVESVTVYELNESVIKLFYFFCNKNKIPKCILDKIKIINQDANSFNNQTFDYGFLDHYELETPGEIIDSVKSISVRNNIKNVWFWPLRGFYVQWAKGTGNDLNYISLNKFIKEEVNIKNLYSNFTPLTHYFAIAGYTHNNTPFKYV